MKETKYHFERTELRTLQIMYEGNNEEFLNILADMLGDRDKKIRQLTDEINQLKWSRSTDD